MRTSSFKGLLAVTWCLTCSFALAQPTAGPEALQMAAYAPYVPQDGISTVLGMVDPTTYTVIRDVYFEGDTLTILTHQQPMTVKKAFLLPTPDRYVVDLDHAVLGNKDLTRVITQNHPDIQMIKIGQFDDKTVRLVIQLVPSNRPLDIVQKESPKSLRLMFSTKPAPAIQLGQN